MFFNLGVTNYVGVVSIFEGPQVGMGQLLGFAFKKPVITY